jgi:tRNA A37 N6-isopentenylltransferase MiaA
MTLRHGNRVRKNGGEQVVRELKSADPVEMAESEPTEDEIRQRAHEIYLSRNGAPGNAELDWLQAEAQLLACRTRARRD